MPVSFSRGVHGIRRSLALLLFAATLAACTTGGTAVVTPLATATNAETTAEPATGPIDSAMIVQIDAPPAGATITSPMTLRGRLVAVPREGRLSYRILDAENFVLGTGTISTTGEVGKPGTFETQMLYSALGAGPGFIQILQRDDAGGVAALGTTVVQIVQNVTTPPTAQVMFPTPPTTVNPYPIATNQPVGPTPTSVPTTGPQGQLLTITSPAPQTQVGSPMTITGNAARFPAPGSLDYRIVNANNQQLGAGSFAVSGAAGQGASFVAQLVFALPPGGGPIRLDVYERGSGNGQIAASTSLNLNVAGPAPTAGPQTITITSPAPQTQVGSPVTITGNTVRFPAQGRLQYRFLDSAGNQLGAGALPVSGSTGQPATFSASLVFNLPPGGGLVRFEVSDTSNNASSALDLAVTPPATVVPQQRITISSPAPGTQVGSPVTITGSAANFPSDGNLDYRVVDAANRQIGGSTFPVSGGPGQAASFVAALTFTPPPNGGSVYVEISDRATGGAVLASSAVMLQVAPQPVPPTATPIAPTAPPVAQTLQITSPVSGTVVSEPFSIQGTTTAYPNDGNLFYRVLNEQGAEIGSGTFNVQGAPGQPTVFTATITYKAPAPGASIRVQLLDRNDRSRAVGAQTEARYRYDPGAYPQPR